MKYDKLTIWKLAIELFYVNFNILHDIQCESKKSPLRGPDIFHFFYKRLRIFNWFFAHLLYVPIYTRLQTFIQLSPILTKLCHNKRDYPVHVICSVLQMIDIHFDVNFMSCFAGRRQGPVDCCRQTVNADDGRRSECDDGWDAECNIGWDDRHTAVCCEERRNHDWGTDHGRIPWVSRLLRFSLFCSVLYSSFIFCLSVSVSLMICYSVVKPVWLTLVY